MTLTAQHEENRSFGVRTNSALKSGGSLVNKNVLMIPGDRQFSAGQATKTYGYFFDLLRSLRAIWLTQVNLRNQAIALKTPPQRGADTVFPATIPTTIGLRKTKALSMSR